MKTKITNVLSKPRIVIPLTAIIFLVLGIIIYPSVGNAPKTDILISNSGNVGVSNLDQNLNLSFPKGGRVESVLVKKGDSVSKGEVLATLSAPDAKGVISQTKGALALAEAELASLNLNYANTKKQQDTLVDNAYQNLLKTTPEAVAVDTQEDNITKTFDLPVISGNYLLGKEGVITIKTYNAAQGLSFNATGLVTTTNKITESPTPLGDSGLSIEFGSRVDANLTWTITLPNINSQNYATNKNAYDLAVVNREKVLSELSQNIDANDSGGSVAKAKVDAARGAYEAALGAYQSNVITSPISGVVDFVDENLKAGQSVNADKTVISINLK